MSLSWMPISIVALLCIAVVVGVVAVQNSWWTDTSAPSDDQQAPDGMSMFGDPGVDFFTRDGTVRVKVRADSLPATELGLEPDAAAVFESIVPISAVILGADGAFTLDLVKTITVTTAGNLVESVDLVQDGRGSWLSIYPQLQRIAPSWGWTAEQLDQLQADLTAASRESASSRYSATLPHVEHKGVDNWKVIAEASRPPLTTVDLNLEEIGRRAAARLLEEMEGGSGRPGIELIPTWLTVRQSTEAVLRLA